MTQHRALWISVAVLVASLLTASPGHAYIINFDDLANTTGYDPVTTEYSSLGVTFANTSLLTAGITLDEIEAPPHSGQNVAFNDGGPMMIYFTNPVLSAGAYFTYVDIVPLVMTAFDIAGNVVASDTSLFSSNLALTGEPGSSPNEFLQVAYAGGISMLEINGSSFVMDDFTSPVPEPSMLLLLGSSLLGLIGFRRLMR